MKNPLVGQLRITTSDFGESHLINILGDSPKVCCCVLIESNANICSLIINLSTTFRGDKFMNGKINTLFDYMNQLCESDLDRIINFVLSVICAISIQKKNPAVHTITKHMS